MSHWRAQMRKTLRSLVFHVETSAQSTEKNLMVTPKSQALENMFNKNFDELRMLNPGLWMQRRYAKAQDLQEPAYAYDLPVIHASYNFEDAKDRVELKISVAGMDETQIDELVSVFIGSYYLPSVFLMHQWAKIGPSTHATVTIIQ